LIVDGRPQPDTLHSGAFDIVGLLATIQGATEPGPPACVVFDGLDTLLTMLPSPNAQRGELLRLQDFVQRLGSTIILTIKATLSRGHRRGRCEEPKGGPRATHLRNSLADFHQWRAKGLDHRRSRRS
jgi:hypothetical protein